MSMSEAKKRFMSHPSDKEKQRIVRGIENGTLMTTEHGSVDEMMILKRLMEEHNGDN